MSFLRNDLRPKLREQMAAIPTTKSVMLTTSIRAKPCLKRNMSHHGRCCGEAIATCKLALEQAAEKFTFISDPARRPAAAAAALKRYQDHQAQKGGGNPKPDKLECMCAMTKVVTCYNVDRCPATSPLTRLCAGRRTCGAARGLQV
eukprot:1113639-Pleurochrysis_carterae.AAC.2